MEWLEIKLQIDGAAKRVVFAEADKSFVDFLARILSLPVDSFLGNDAKIGSLGNLHVSIGNLDGYGQQRLVGARVESLLQRRSSYGFPLRRREAAGGGGGGVSYIVMDDLTVAPMSLAELKKLNLKNVANLEEKIVFLGKDEAVKLLSASLQSKNVLTDVFLKDSNYQI